MPHSGEGHAAEAFRDGAGLTFASAGKRPVGQPVLGIALFTVTHQVEKMHGSARRNNRREGSFIDGADRRDRERARSEVAGELLHVVGGDEV